MSLSLRTTLDAAVAPLPSEVPSGEPTQEEERKLHDFTLTSLRQYAEATFAKRPAMLSHCNWVALNYERFPQLHRSMEGVLRNSAEHRKSFEIARGNAKETTRSWMQTGRATKCLDGKQREAFLNLLIMAIWEQALVKELDTLHVLALPPSERQQTIRGITANRLQEANEQIKLWKDSISHDQLEKEFLVGHTRGDKPGAIRAALVLGLEEETAVSLWVNKLCMEAVQFAQWADKLPEQLSAFRDRAPFDPRLKLYLTFCQAERLFGNLTAADEFVKQLKVETGSSKYDLILEPLGKGLAKLDQFRMETLLEISRHDRSGDAEPSREPTAPLPQAGGFSTLLSYLPLWGAPRTPTQDPEVLEKGKKELMRMSQDFKNFPMECVVEPSIRSQCLSPDMFRE